MSYRKTEFSCGTFAHILNRGNNKEKIFFDEQDYRAFLFRLALALGFSEDKLKTDKFLHMPFSRIRIDGFNQNDFKIHAFCLMPNHFHLLVEQCHNESISKLISKLSISYSMYFNKKYKRVGHVLQDRFKSVLIEDDPQLMWVSAYIHMNPVKDFLAKNPLEYTWSSYKDYMGERNSVITSKEFLMELFGGKKGFETETLNYSKKEDWLDLPSPALGS